MAIVPPILRRLLKRFTLAPALAVAACSATSGDPGGTALWNSRNLDGWEIVVKEPVPAGTALLRPAADGILQVAGKPVGYFATQATFADFELILEWRWTEKPGNSGVLLHADATAPGKVWPNCLQVQMRAGTAGELIPMEGFTFAELPPGAKSLPRAAAVQEVAPGAWNTGRIVCRGDTVECWVNGTFASRATKCSRRSGRIGFQFEGAPFELRGLMLRRL